MKILIENLNKTNLGLGKAFTAHGHEVRLWEKRHKSAFDTFDTFEPELFIFSSIDKDIQKCIDERPWLKLYENVNRQSCDIFDVYPDIDTKYSPYITFINRFNNEKDIKIIHQLCYTGYNVKIFGNYVRLPNYCGPEINYGIIKSSQIIIDLDGLDIYSLLYNKCFTVSHNKLKNKFSNPKFDSIQELQYIISKCTERYNEIRNYCYEEVIKDTYFNIAENILKGFNISCQQNKIQEFLLPVHQVS